MSRVYVSYLRQKPANQIVAAARQLLTRKWWESEKSKYELVTSQFVIDEASSGDPTLAAERLALLSGINLLSLDDEIAVIASEMMSQAVLPPQAEVAAPHIAITSFHKVEYLLTWNCTHLANARILPQIKAVLESLGHYLPIICTPEELIGDDSKISD